MVHCTKCGKENADDAKFCFYCGVNVYPRERGKREEKCFGEERREGEECFGLPYGGAIVGIIFGVFIIVLGFAMLLQIDIGRFAGAFAVVIVGVLIIAGALYGLSRRPKR